VTGVSHPQPAPTATLLRDGDADDDAALARARTGDAEYAALARELVATGILSDPWLDGRPRFATAPLVVSPAQADALAHAAEAVALAYDEAAQLCRRDPSLVARFYPALTPFQRRMWHASGGAWHALARADVFITGDGLRVCELNCDTPSGEAEAVLVNAAVARRHPRLADPNRGFEAAFCDTIAACAAGVERDGRAPLTVAILYPTELVEDLSMILLYRRWLEARGARVVLGSPFNLGRAAGGRAALFGVPCDVVIRHYKTDWWSEREPARDDEPRIVDDVPLAEPLDILLSAVAARRCAVVNPFGAVLPQNKSTMALFWEALERFSPDAQTAIRRYVPYTVRLESLPRAQLLAERRKWVLKSDYGCEGAEVVIGAAVDERELSDCVAHARPGRFIAQRRFDAVTDDRGRSVNWGVYLAGGQACAYFARVQRGATDASALTAATLVDDGGSNG
jgi:glutathionylspermidine synthase